MSIYRILAAASLFIAITPSYSQRLLTSRLFGGSGIDQPAAIATDAQGDIYVAGTTTSADLPASHTFQPKPAALPLNVSNDGGATFTNIPIPGVSAIYALAASTDGAMIYAAVPGGLMRSSDSGSTWTAASPGIPVQPGILAVSPHDPSLIFAGARNGFYRSTDGGNHWTLVPSPMSQYQTAFYYQIRFDPFQPSNVWVVAGNTPNPTGIFTSTDDGQTWTPIVLAPIGYSLYSIAEAVSFDPLHSGTIYASGQGIPVFQSTDGGQTWTPLAAAFGIVTVDPSNPAIMYALTGFGIQKSTDGGNTFTSTGFTAAGIFDLEIDPATPSRIYAASNVALYTSGDAGATWTTTSIRSVSQMAVMPGRVLVGGQIPPQAYLAKFSPDLSQLLWATYLGGGANQYITGLAVDAAGNAYLAGTTTSPDFPVTPGALQTTGIAFIAKISADGTALPASTFFGNTGTYPTAIAVDRSGAVYLTGWQSGSGFPTTPRAFQVAPSGACTRPQDPGGFQPQSSNNSFVSKISADFSTLVYSTYLTGTCGSSTFAIEVDNSGAATVVGGTYSLDFPTTSGAMVATPPDSDESGFLTKLSSDGRSLLYSTFLGGGPTTEAHAFLTDSSGNWIVTGGGTPATTPGAAHVKGNGNCPFAFGFGPPIPRPPTLAEEAFVTVFNAHSTSPIFTASVGGSCMDEGDSIALDAAGNIWIAGITSSSDLPTQALLGGMGVAGSGFLAAFTPAGDALLTSSYAGMTPRLTGGAGKVTGTAATMGKLLTTTTLAQFDAVSAPPVELDSVNAYSGTGPLTSIAPGQAIRVAGRHFGPSQTQSGSVANGVVGSSIDGLQVTFDGIAAPLLTLQDQTAALMVPFEVQPYSTVMQFALNGNPVSNPVTVGVAPIHPDVLLVLNADGTVNAAQHPAAAGSTIGVFVTGMGDQTPPVSDGQVAATASASPAVTVGPNVAIGSVPTQPSYVGTAVGLVAGIVQINIPVPQVSGQVLLQTQQFNVYVYVSR